MAKNLKKNIYIYMYIYTNHLLYTWNIVNQLCFNKDIWTIQQMQKKKAFNKINTH